ncbi:sensor histidine kinase [Alteromonas ponticola]|uniref:Histidine kinase n=1 Tax=Alteromonas ponticola TaxID=2720613 RepID=A0ABX1R504_9ALTE|nr:histidine kinase [Alteromonas ponticola]NMH61517.1 histidine kinase [Alteromonas ponticola]
MSITETLPLLAEGRKKKWSYSSLIFSLFYFVPLLFGTQVSANAVLLLSAGYLLFVLVYLACIHHSVRWVPYFTVAMLMLAYATSFINPGGAIIFGFIAFIVGYYYPFKIGLIFSLLIVSSIILVSIYNSANELFFTLLASLNIVVLLIFGMMERKETLFQLKQAQHADSIGTLSALEERERIGRDLHDIAGHSLSVISLKAQVADKLLANGKIEAAQQEVRALATLTQTLLSEIRQTVSGIKALSLSEAIAQMQAKLTEHDIELSVSVEPDTLKRLNAVQHTQLSLIIKELTTNILRYSRSTHITLSLLTSKNTAIFSLSENRALAMPPTEGNGLAGIRERADHLKAQVSFSWQPNVSFKAIIPLEPI